MLLIFWQKYVKKYQKMINEQDGEITGYHSEQVLV